MNSGRIRALGVASSKRSPALPGIPAIGESLKGFEADSWFGIMMPAGTPRDIIVKFDSEVQKALSTQEVRDRLLAVGGFVVAGGPEQLAGRIRADIAKVGQGRARRERANRVMREAHQDAVARVSEERLWRRLMQMGGIGAIPNNGVNRPALSHR